MKSQAAQVVMAKARWCLCLAALLLLHACATGPQANPADPLEPFNRGVTQFNDAVDEAFLKPVAKAYQDIAPSMARTGIGNFFGNIADVWSFINDLLQFKPQAATESLMRVGVNTIFGLGGVLDVATELQIPKHNEDFGQTLGRWGVGDGAYVVLPFFGPSTVRDAVGRWADTRGDLVKRVRPVRERNATYFLRVVDTRSDLLSAGDLLEQAALDKYSFIRDAYLQRRHYQINDGADENLMPQEPAPIQKSPLAPATVLGPQLPLVAAQTQSQAGEEEIIVIDE